MRTPLALAVVTLAAPALAAPALVAPARADVLVVDPSGIPGTFAEVQHAVDAASDGDVIVVRTGAYAAVHVVGKSLTIVEDVGHDAVLGQGLRASTVTFHQTLVLSGLTMTGSTVLGAPPAGSGLWLDGNPGAIRVESCNISGPDHPPAPIDCQAQFPGAGWHGVFAFASHDAVFVDCTIAGGDGGSVDGTTPAACPLAVGGDGGNGVRCQNSTSLAFYDCTVAGGDGGAGPKGGPGRPALTSVQCGLFLSDSAWQGGAGGAGLGNGGGNGGPGISQFGFPTTFLDVAASGGAGGADAMGGDGAAGAPVAAISAITTLTGGARHFGLPGLAYAGTDVTASFGGEAGELAVLAFGPWTENFTMLALAGVLHVGAPAILAATPLDETGSGSLALGAPPLLAGEGWTVLLQTAFVSPGGALRLGPPRSLTVVGPLP